MADLTPEQRARVEEAARDMAFKFGVLAGYEMDAIRAGLVPDQRANVRAGRKSLQAAERALLATVEAVVGEVASQRDALLDYYRKSSGYMNTLIDGSEPPVTFGEVKDAALRVVALGPYPAARPESPEVDGD